MALSSQPLSQVHKVNNYGINLENYGVPPDVWVQNTAMDEAKGYVRELQAAIDEVMRMLK